MFRRKHQLPLSTSNNWQVWLLKIRSQVIAGHREQFVPLEMKRNKWVETKEELSKCEKGDEILVRRPSGRSKCVGFPKCPSFRLCNLGPEWFAKCHLCSLPHSGFCWTFRAISTNIYTTLYNLQKVQRCYVILQMGKMAQKENKAPSRPNSKELESRLRFKSNPMIFISAPLFRPPRNRDISNSAY